MGHIPESGYQDVTIEVSSLIRARRHYDKVFNRPADYVDSWAGEIRYHLPQSGYRVTVKVRQNSESECGTNETGIELDVTDLSFEYQRLQSLGVAIVGDIEARPGGRFALRLADSDGNQAVYTA